MNKWMPVVYVAGPYRARTREGVSLNIQSALQVGKLVCLKGYSPLIPHANTGHLDAVTGLEDQFWLDATMELMLRCDAVVLCPGWEYSAGTLAEIERAKAEGIPVFNSPHDIPDAERFAESLNY